MATTTTNFGWDIPQSTDLVKDGATAIAALGQDIDTALIDLKGGTSGQVLAKASGTDLDFSWVAQDDSNAIQNDIVDAKGDLIAATAADTPARLAVGTNGQVLTADSTEATGMKWAASGATFVGCSVSNVSNSSVTATNNTVTVIPFDTEAYDTDGFHSTATNTSRMTIPTGKGGKYICTGKFRWDTNTTGTRFITFVINGTDQDYNNLQPYAASPYSTHTAVFSLADNDYIEIAAYQDSGGSRTVNLNSQQSKFTISYLGA
jgi:hypothetical protein